MNSLNKKARIAGIIYLFMGITAGYALMLIPSKFMVDGDSAATANHIIESENLYRLVILFSIVGQASFVFLVLAFKDLFQNVNLKITQLMVGLVYVSVPIAIINSLFLIAAQMVISGSDYLMSFSTDQLQSLMMLFLDLFQHGIWVVEIFWGLWLFPLGLLVYKSGFLPKIIGILLIVACFGYLAENVSSIIWPNMRESVSTFTSISGSVAELSMLLWLIVFGARKSLFKPAV